VNGRLRRRLGRTWNAILEGDRSVHKKQRHIAHRFFERLRDEREFSGGYCRAPAKSWDLTKCRVLAKSTRHSRTKRTARDCIKRLASPTPLTTLICGKFLLSSNRRQNLTSLNDRIAEFIVDRLPNEGSAVELLCVDHNGTYVVPFPCRRVADSWRNTETNEVIEADVAGWRQRRSQAPGKSVG
jgi:hypothetical protein